MAIEKTLAEKSDTGAKMTPETSETKNGIKQSSTVSPLICVAMNLWLNLKKIELQTIPPRIPTAVPYSLPMIMPKHIAIIGTRIIEEQLLKPTAISAPWPVSMLFIITIS